MMAMRLSREQRIPLSTFPEEEKPSNTSRVMDFKCWHFRFDGVYDKECTQQHLYATEVKPLVNTLINGFDCTVFCYGMTGSGKTYTMQGPDHDPGIIPRTVASMVDLLKDEKFGVNISCFEVYNERIFDSLKGDYSNSLAVRQDCKGNINISNLSEARCFGFSVLTLQVPLTSIADWTATYAQFLKNRKVGATALNEFSSRSHAILRLVVRFTLFVK